MKEENTQAPEADDNADPQFGGGRDSGRVAKGGDKKPNQPSTQKTKKDSHPRKSKAN